MNTDDYSIPSWTPGNTITISFDDKTARRRSKAKMSQMIKDLRDVANRYDFDLQSWGTHESFVKLAKHYCD
jgi:hypothetical protein